MRPVWEVPIVDLSLKEPKTTIVYMRAQCLPDHLAEVVPNFEDGDWYIDYCNIRKLTTPIRQGVLPEKSFGVIWLISEAEIVATYFDESLGEHIQIPSGRPVNTHTPWLYWCDEPDLSKVLSVLTEELKKVKK